MRILRLAALTSAAVVAAASLGTLGAHAAAPTRLEPDRLPRGADIAVPHVDGSTFVDGSRQIELGAPVGRLLGASGDAWIVTTWSRDGMRKRRVLRVEADGSLTTLMSRVPSHGVKLSEDGKWFATLRNNPPKRTSTLRIWSAVDGSERTTATLKGYPTLLTMRGNRAIVTDWERGTFEWRMSGRMKRLTTMPAGLANIENDVLAAYDGDPYMGGCTRVSKLTRPGKAMWRSCEERVDSLSPDGSRMVTVHILSDGIGPREVNVRKRRGGLVATYRTGGWFGAFAWENATTPLFEVNGKRQASIVRCRITVCENATDPAAVVQPRARG